jgi:hypothetical protein
MAVSTPNLDFTVDTIVVQNKTSVTDDRGVTKSQNQDQEITLAQLRAEIMSDPAGSIEVKVDEIIDFTGNATKYKNVCTIPAGSKVKLATVQITELVVGGSTTVKLGLGPNGGDVDQLGITAALTKNTQINKVPTDALGIIASQTAIDLNGVVTNGSALGDTNVTAGKARVIIVYDKPAVLANV